MYQIGLVQRQAILGGDDVVEIRMKWPELTQTAQPALNRPAGACYTATSSLPAGSLLLRFGVERRRVFVIRYGEG